MLLKLMIIFFTITERDIYFQEQLLKAMKSKYASQLKAKDDANKINSVKF